MSPLSTPAGSRRLITWAICCLTLLAGLFSCLMALPFLAPQFVITHSPWIWPVLRAEAYETEGLEPDLDSPTYMAERNNLLDRLLNEEHWEQDAIPVLIGALDHPDLRMRRTAMSALYTLLTENNSRTPQIPDGHLVTHLRRLLDDPDPSVFDHAFRLLIHHENSSSAHAILVHLPRKCGADPVLSVDSLDARLSVFFGAKGEPHPLRHLRLTDLVGQAMLWLATNDPDLIRLALMTLRFSNDPQALPLLDTHLGKHLETAANWVGWDPATYALSSSSLPDVNDLLVAAIASPDPVRRRSAAGTLAGRRDMGAGNASLALLRDYIDDVDDEVRQQVVIALLQYPLEQTLPDLCRIIARGGESAVIAIDHIRSQRMFLHRHRPWLGRGNVVPAVNPDTPENWAMEARIFNEISSFVTHPEPAVRFALARYLCNTWEPDTERTLQLMVNDQDPQVRAEIAAELQSITTRTRRDRATYRHYVAPGASGTASP